MDQNQTSMDGSPTAYKDFLKEIKRNMDPNNNTVLLVDDERGIRRKVARDVRAFDPNIAIFEAVNGQEALKKLEEIRAKFYRDPLFIVLDLHMPVMDGWEVIDALRKDYESKGKSLGIPIIVLSSTSGEKGGFLRKRTVHEGKSGYDPLVCIAKETCVDAQQYDAEGERGLIAWIEHFVRG